MKTLFAILIMMGFTLGIKAQAAGGTDTIKIKTSAVCDMCKEAIEKAMAYEKGVKSASLDLENKVLTVVYKTEKITPAQLRQAVSLTGYDADDVPANASAYSKLHKCCKKGSH
jgi:periplasmic mercuric ion binding protein